MPVESVPDLPPILDPGVAEPEPNIDHFPPPDLGDVPAEGEEYQSKSVLTAPKAASPRTAAGDFVTRAQWGARLPRNRTSLPTVVGNTVHYEGGALGAYDHGKCVAMVRQIQNYHMDSNGWADIAYNTITCRHGVTYEGRGYGIRSAANGSNPGNDQSFAHCVMIGLGDEFTADAQAGIRKIVQDYENRGSGRKRWVHSDWFSTQCPGDPVRTWLRAGMPGAVPPTPSTPNGGTVVVNAPPVTLLNHPDWDGYLQVCADGGVVNWGTAPFYGSAGAVKLNSPIVDADVMPSGKGYILVAADGGVFGYGDAPFKGSMGGKTLNAPCVAITLTKTGQGYWITGKDGAVFAFGDASFKGAVQYSGPLGGVQNKAMGILRRVFPQA